MSGQTIGICQRCDGRMYHNGERFIHIANNKPLPDCPTGEEMPRIRLDADGTLDDFYAEDIRSVHFEAMDQSQWYLSVTLNDGQVWQLRFGARNDRAKGYAFTERVQ